MTNVWPNGSLTMPRVTSEFDPARKNPVTGIVQPHQGIDMVGFDAIISPVTGTVTFAGYNGGAGNEVRIREDGTGDVIRLLHNRALNTRTGARVAQGATVAWMGSTGQSTGPHCHEETRPGGGSPINPRDWYARRNTGAAGSGGTTPAPILKDDEMIRIQAPNRGIALIGPGYFRPLANDEEVNNSAPLISAHHTGNDRQFDLWVSMAIQGNIAGGVADIVRTESRPFKLHNTSKGLEAFGPGGKTWLVPSDAYRVLLDALMVAGPHVGRTLPDNERTFLITLLETLSPDPVNAGKVEAVLSISEEDAQRIADRIKVASPDQVADVLADRLAE